MVHKRWWLNAHLLLALVGRGVGIKGVKIKGAGKTIHPHFLTAKFAYFCMSLQHWSSCIWVMK